MPWDLAPKISHGTIVIEKFYSETLKQIKCCSIYLPPSYGSTRKSYPVFYLLHGGGGDYGSWVFDGKIDNIMDYLLSKAKTKEMIVVIPDGNVMPIGSYLVNIRTFSAEWERMMRIRAEKYSDYFFKDIVPFIESRYRVSKGARTIAGLSMGGMYTSNVILSHPEMFVAAGIFSSGASEDSRDRFASVRDQLKRYKLLYVSPGNWDFALEGSRKLHSILEELKISHIYVEGEGGHIWPLWQRSVVDFIPRL
jgi:enterochelin esterase family protein